MRLLTCLCILVLFFSFDCYTRSFSENAELFSAVARGATGMISHGVNEPRGDQSQPSAMARNTAFLRLIHGFFACYNHWDDQHVIHYLAPWLLFDCWRAYSLCALFKNKAQHEEAKKFSIASGLALVGKMIASGFGAYAGAQLALGTSPNRSANMLSLACALEHLLQHDSKNSYDYAQKGFCAAMLGLGLTSFFKREIPQIKQTQEIQENNSQIFDNHLTEALWEMAKREKKIMLDCHKEYIKLFKYEEKRAREFVDIRIEHETNKKRLLEIEAQIQESY